MTDTQIILPADTNGGARRFTDKFNVILLSVVGTMTLLLWGIVWNGLSATQADVTQLKVGQGANQEQIKSMDRKLDRIETKIEKLSEREK